MQARTAKTQDLLRAFAHDAFICHRRVDGDWLAKKIRDTLEKYQLPKKLRAGRPRLKVYVDRPFERASTDFWGKNILPNLRDSKYLIVVCTPKSLADPKRGEIDWVKREISAFQEFPQRENLIIVTYGIDPMGPLPSNIRKLYPRVNAINLGSKPPFKFGGVLGRRLLNLQDSKLAIVAALYGVDDNNMPELRGEERGRRRNQLVTRVFLSIALILPIIRLQVNSDNSQNLISKAHEEIAMGNRGQALNLALRGLALRDTPEGRMSVARCYPQLLMELKGHTDQIISMSFSPDGEKLATAGRDNTARLWSVATGRQLGTMTGHSGPVWDVEFSPDGKSLVTASLDNTARVWAADDGRLLMTMIGHRNFVYKARFSPDGRRVVTASLDSTARIWNVITGHEEFAIQEQPSGIGLQDAVFSPDGQRILTTGLSADTAYIWNATTGETTARLTGHSGEVTYAAFSPDGRLIVTASNDRTAALWNASNGAFLRELEGHEGPVSKALFWDDGRRIITASMDGTTRIWETASGRLIRVMGGHTGPVLDVDTSRDSQLAVTAGADKTARVWDLVNGKMLAEIEDAATPNLVAFSRDRTSFASAIGNSVKIWNLAASSREISMFPAESGLVHGSSLSLDGSRMVLTGGGPVSAWNIVSLQPIAKAEAPSNTVIGVTISSNGKRFLMFYGNQMIDVRDTDTGRLRTRFRSRRLIFDSALSRDGNRLATEDTVWDTARGEEIFTYNGEPKPVHSAISPNGDKIAIALADNTAGVWSILGERTAVFNGHHGRINDIVFSPDGKVVATASDDATARTWDEKTGKNLSVMRGHDSAVLSVMFSSDSGRLATTRSDNTAQIWSVFGGKMLATLEGHTGRVRGANFSPDGKWVLTASEDKTACVWNATDGRLLAKVDGHIHDVLDIRSTIDDQRIVTRGLDGKVLVSQLVSLDELRSLFAKRSIWKIFDNN